MINWKYINHKDMYINHTLSLIFLLLYIQEALKNSTDIHIFNFLLKVFSLIHTKSTAVVEYPPSDDEHIVRRVRYNCFRSRKICEYIPYFIHHLECPQKIGQSKSDSPTFCEHFFYVLFELKYSRSTWFGVINPRR